MSDEDTRDTEPLELRRGSPPVIVNVPGRESAEPGTPDPEPATPASAILVKIERVKREEQIVDPETGETRTRRLPMIRMPFEDGSGSGSTQHYNFLPPNQNTFEVSAIVAAAAIETGFFRAVE